MPESDQRSPTGQAAHEPLPTGVKLLIGALFATGVASRSVLVALGLLVFDITGQELDLGLLGLAMFIPVFVLAPFTGTMADRYDRRVVFGVGLAIEMASTAALFVLARGEPTSIAPILGLVLIFGVAAAINAPASRALPIDLAPPGLVERVVALRSVAFQTGNIVGPLVAGLLFTVNRSFPFALSLLSFSVAVALLRLVPATGLARIASRTGPAQAVRDAVEGLRFVRRTPVVMGAITLDLFAVLFGGAVALLPAIGEKQLGVDEAAIGFLYSAIGIGALITSALLAVRPIRRHVGLVLFGVVATFGAATIVLGLTKSYIVAVVALVVLSAADSVSVFIRATIVPLATPENMRGRVLAVENVFIGGSNELGALESGLTAAWFGLVTAVVLGGIGTLAVVGIAMAAFPALRQVDRFEDLRAASPRASDT